MRCIQDAACTQYYKGNKVILQCHQTLLWPAISHPHILPLYPMKLNHYYYTRFPSLHDMVRLYGSIRPKQLLVSLTHTIKALSYLHEQGIIHSNITESTIFYNRETQQFYLGGCQFLMKGKYALVKEFKTQKTELEDLGMVFLRLATNLKHPTSSDASTLKGPLSSMITALLTKTMPVIEERSRLPHEIQERIEGYPKRLQAEIIKSFVIEALGEPVFLSLRQMDRMQLRDVLKDYSEDLQQVLWSLMQMEKGLYE